jgi:tetratricopeptide (TPR) repeat protein
MKIIIGMMLALLGVVSAIAGPNGGTDSPFSMGAGARDLALGGAVVSCPDPVTSPYWNPATLAWAENLSVSGFHSRLYESDVVYQYIGVAVPTLQVGGFGIGVFRLGVSGIERCEGNNFCAGQIDDNRLGFYLGYGRRVSGYDVGAALSLERHSLGEYTSTSSPGLNLAISRRFGTGLDRLHTVTAGIVGRNLVRPGIKMADETVKLPYSVDTGISLAILPLLQRNHGLTLVTALTNSDRDDPVIAVGLEYEIGEWLRLRGGLRRDDPSFGVGISYKALCFDYAMVDRDLGSLHMFSVTTDLGTPISERRRIQEEERESRFNTLVSERLTDQNRDLVEGLITQGQELIRSGDLEQAKSNFDRAIFLASGSGLDTSMVFRVAQETSDQLDLALRKRTFDAYMDSASAKMSSQDYLEARYFASLALARLPGSGTAIEMISRVDAAIELNATRDTLVESRLLVADSLLSYGKTDEALAIASTLTEIAPDDGRVDLLIKKAEFEHWLALGEEAFSRSEHETARAAVDSALSRFPRHPSCLGLLSRIEAQLSPEAPVATTVEPPSREPMTEEMIKQVERAYRTAQDLFEKGRLSEAVSQWERVERLAPDYKSVREYLVSAYKYLGVEFYTGNRLSDAVDVWKKAIVLAPDNAEIESYIRRTESEISRLQELSYDNR